MVESVTAQDRKRIRFRKKIKNDAISYSFVLPSLILFLTTSVYPIFWVLKYMFYQYGGKANSVAKFVGLDNFARVMRDSVYWESVGRTFIYGFGKLIFTLPVAFMLALLLNKKGRANGIAQSLVFMPTILSSAVMGLVFYLLFNVYNGEINTMLQKAGIISKPVNWLGKDYAMLTVILVAVWGAIGNYMVYFIAGIQRVSQEAIESAQIDGANGMDLIWYIILPMMGPVLKIVLMLAITGAFKDISSVLVLTEGGPANRTMVMALYGYRFFFPVSASESVSTQYGYGSAVSVVSGIIIGVFTVIYLKITKKLDEVY